MRRDEAERMRIPILAKFIHRLRRPAPAHHGHRSDVRDP